jgi:glycosyltransferase involved in cell wall biosynthesis
MRVFYDGVIYTRQRYGGVSRVFDNLTSELADFSGIKTCCFRFPDSFGVPPRDWYFVPKLGGALRRLDALAAPPLSARSNADIYHTTYLRLPERVDAPTMATIHDTIHAAFPEQFANTERVVARKRRCVEAADALIAVSEHTKRDLIEYYDVPAGKVHVVYNGVDPFFSERPPAEYASTLREHGVSEPFVLYVGNRTGYKNFATLLTAFTDWERAGEYELVCVGSPPEWTDDERAAITEAGLRSAVTLAANVNDETLRDFYAAAAAFVYPSKYEGFGLPPLEAMRCRTPVIAANAASIPEVVGDAGLYFDPESSGTLVEQLERLATDQSLRGELVSAGADRAEQFTWRRTATETLAVYRDLLN